MLDAKRLEELILEARARITWGEAPEAVESWLKEEGVDQLLIDDVLHVSNRERDRDIRSMGLSEVVKGLALGLLSGGAIFTMIAIGFVQRQLFAASIAGVIYGTFRFVRGLLWLVRGRHMSGSVGDLDN